MLPNYFYNNSYTIVQSKDTVMILTEMVHDARVVRMNGTHPPASLRKWFGDSIGRWEGDTLVIETTNFHPSHGFRSSWENLKVTERHFAPGRATLNYRFTVEDPTTFTAPFTGELVFNAMAPGEMVYEYACHEANYGLEGVMSGARAQEREAAKKKTATAVSDAPDSLCGRPAVLIDQAKALRNLDRMQAEANARGIRLRPHSKTHKSPLVARWQIDRGAIGICCAKLGEAEVFAEPSLRSGHHRTSGFPIRSIPSNADRVIALLDRTHLSFIVDHPAVAKQWSEAMTRRGQAGRRAREGRRRLPSLRHRSGLARCASTMIRGVAALPGCGFKGLLSHAGQAYHAHSEDELRAMAEAEARTMSELAERCRKAGVPIEEISAGATPPARFSIQQKGFTEYRPGNYVYFDRTQVALGAATMTTARSRCSPRS